MIDNPSPQTAAQDPVQNATLYVGLAGVAKAKPDSMGHCNAGKCLCFSAAVVERSLKGASRLGKALSSNDLKRILKSADILEARAKTLRAAVEWVKQGNNGHE